METFFIIGFAILFAFTLVCICEYFGRDLGKNVGDGLYGNTFEEKFKNK